MTQMWPGPEVRVQPPFPVPKTSPGGRGTFGDISFGLTDEPYLVLRAEELPPPSVLLVDGIWALITLGSEPIAFVSPDVVRGLQPDEPVGRVLDGVPAAYVAAFGRPADFFRSRLGRPRTVRGRVFVLSQDYARRATTARLTEFDDECDLGTILPVGEICNDDCSCGRRDQ